MDNTKYNNTFPILSEAQSRVLFIVMLSVIMIGLALASNNCEFWKYFTKGITLTEL